MSIIAPITCLELNDPFVDSSEDESEGTSILYRILFVICNSYYNVYNIIGFGWNML